MYENKIVLYTNHGAEGRSSRPELFYEKGDLKDFVKLIGKDPFQSDCNGIRTRNHLVFKRTLSHLDVLFINIAFFQLGLNVA